MANGEASQTTEASQSVMDLMLEEYRKTNQLLETVVQNQLEDQKDTKEMKAMLQNLQTHAQHQLWYQGELLMLTKIQEARQSMTTPDGNDSWRHADQVASGELWSGSDPVWKTLAHQLKSRITSKGQLPAECDLRRGQYRAVYQFLKENDKLCTTKAQGWDELEAGPPSGEGTPATSGDAKSPATPDVDTLWPDDQNGQAATSGEGIQDGEETQPTQKTRKRKNGYDFQCGQVFMCTPYAQRQFDFQGVTAEEIRQTLGYTPGFMAQCFRVAMDAKPLNKDFQPFPNDQEYQDKMHAMVSSDQIKRLGEGWMIWARAQASDWEQMETHDQPDKEAIQARLANPLPQGS